MEGGWLGQYHNLLLLYLDNTCTERNSSGGNARRTRAADAIYVQTRAWKESTFKTNQKDSPGRCRQGVVCFALDLLAMNNK